jgi:hypothetical protein
MTAFAPGDRVRVITLWSHYRGRIGLVVPGVAKRDGFLAQTVSFEGAHEPTSCFSRESWRWLKRKETPMSEFKAGAARQARRGLAGRSRVRRGLEWRG